MSKIRVLVVDDSSFMRKALEAIMNNAPDIELVGVGVNGKEGVELAAELKPDVITMDIEMPIMDGITALGLIMKQCPTSVIMVSSLTKEGAESTLKALDMGAVDFIPKLTSVFGGANLEEELLNKIRKLAKSGSRISRLSRPIASSRPLTTSTTTPTTTPTRPLTASATGTAPRATGSSGAGSSRIVTRSSTHKTIVALGTSTGGPQSLQQVIPKLPADIGVPIVITQHMPPNFTASLAARLDASSKLTVIEAQGKEKLEPNVVYIAKGGFHLKFRKMGASVYTELSEEPAELFNRPSVDVMISSITSIYKSSCLGVIMTGMGSDGALGMRDLKAAGGFVVSQDEPSSIVYGMPKSVVEAGLADEIVPLDEISERIIFHCR